MMRTALLFCALCAMANASQQQANPIEKIVELITELKAKIETDGKAEQKVYDKFACWCEKTTAAKTDSIEEAQASITELTQIVTEAKATKATLTAEIKQLEKDIAANEASTSEATNIRNKEHADYETTATESEQTIQALEHAVKVLTGAGEGSGEEEADLLSVAAEVRARLHHMPKDMIKGDQMEKVREFVKNPTAFFAHKQATFSAAQVSQNPFGDYAPASTAIQGTLKSMYDEFTANLESANAEESSKQKSFEELSETKAKELAMLQATMENKQTSLGETEKNLADSDAERAATQHQLDHDEQFFEDTKEACKLRSSQWAERSRLRTQELHGVGEAIEILSGDSVKETFGRATSMFLQTAEETDRPQWKAYQALKKAAKKTHSAKLVALASSVKSLAPGGKNFGVVIKSIDKMLGELRVEEQEDIDHKDSCFQRETKLTHEKEDLEYKAKQTEALIERLEKKSGELEAAIANSEAEILETQEAMAEALATRTEENDDFKAALKDDTDAIALLAGALKSLTAFAKNNNINLLELGRKRKQDPEGAPSTGFDTPYGGASSQTGGIVGVITMLKEDLEAEVKESKSAEAAAQSEYKAQRQAAEATVKALKAKKTDQEMQKADTDEKTQDNEDLKADTENQAVLRQESLDAIEPNCEWIKGAFDSRMEKRKAEMDGMIEAKAVLAGSAPSAAFMQVKRH